MRYAARDIEQLPVGEFPEYSPAGDCHFLPVLGAIVGIGAAAIGAKSAYDTAKAQQKAAKATSGAAAAYTADLETELAATKATNETLVQQAQQFRLSNTADRLASDYFPAGTSGNQVILLGIGLVVVLAIYGRKIRNA